MTDNYYVLRIIVITLLLTRIVASSSENHVPSEHILEAIQDSMTRSPATWPDEWKQEYIETIHSVVELHRDVPYYALRLEILSKGFMPYWEGFTKTKDRSLFEVHRAQIRWYVEHLMSTDFPSDDERQKLRDQYKDLWDHAVSSLLAQFPFLDPNAVQIAKQEDLSVCYHKIDAPLMPVYLRPFSEAQVEQIKQCWDDLRYTRVDLLRKLTIDSTGGSH